MAVNAEWNTRTEDAESVVGDEPAVGDAPNLRQRILAIIKQVEGTKPTGKNAFQNKAYSVEDIENAIRGPLTQHGVIIRWSSANVQPVDQAMWGRGGPLWMHQLLVTMENAESPEDCFTDYQTDIGNSPTAAESFAKKAYYKSLFHIAEAGDDVIEESDHGNPAQKPVEQPRQQATKTYVDTRKAQPAAVTPAPTEQVSGITPQQRERMIALCGELGGLYDPADTWQQTAKRGLADLKINAKTPGELTAPDAEALIAWAQTDLDIRKTYLESGPAPSADGTLFSEDEMDQRWSGRDR